MAVPSDASDRDKQYTLALEICERNADYAIQTYRRIDEKAERFMTFTALVAAAVFAAITKEHLGHGLILTSFIVDVVALGIFACVRIPLPLQAPVDGRWTVETAGLSDLQLMQARIAATYHVQAQGYRRQLSLKNNLFMSGLFTLLLGFVLLAIGTARISMFSEKTPPESNPVSVAVGEEAAGVVKDVSRQP